MTALVEDDVEIGEGALHRRGHFGVVVLHHGTHEAPEVEFVAAPSVVPLVDAFAVRGPTRCRVALFVLGTVALELPSGIGLLPRPHVVGEDGMIRNEDNASGHANLALATTDGHVEDVLDRVIHPHNQAGFAFTQHRVGDVVGVEVGASDERRRGCSGQDADRPARFILVFEHLNCGGAVEQDRKAAVVHVTGVDLRFRTCLTGFVLHVGHVARQARGRPHAARIAGQGVAVRTLHLVVAVRVDHGVAKELHAKEVRDGLGVGRVGGEDDLPTLLGDEVVNRVGFGRIEGLLGTGDDEQGAVGLLPIVDKHRGGHRVGDGVAHAALVFPEGTAGVGDLLVAQVRVRLFVGREDNVFPCADEGDDRCRHQDGDNEGDQQPRLETESFAALLSHCIASMSHRNL